MQTSIKYGLLFLLFSCGFLVAAQQDRNNFVVVLDAGHGGKDPGRPTNYGYKEKDIALNIVLKLGKLLEKQDRFEVIYTRKKDVFLELHERAKIANKADADLFVSVHCNAHNSNAYGSETYALALRANNANFDIAKQENEVIFLEEDYETQYAGFDPNAPESLIGLTLIQEDYLDQSITLASYVQENFTDDLKRKNRGVKQAGFWVLHNTYMPSILVETGFITNRNEGRYLNSESGQNAMAQAIAEAIIRYENELRQNANIAGLPGLDNTSAPAESSTITYKVQIAASKRKLETRPYNFKGLADVSREARNNMYRYYYGEVTNYNAAKTLRAEAVQAGYVNSFIVAYRDGVRIALDDALKSSSD